jgi:hypothetical protein
MTCESHRILPSVDFYADHCEILEFWSFWDLPVDALRSVELENGVSLLLFSSQELLLRINDLPARSIIARRLQILREKAFNHKYFGKKHPSLL